MKNLYIIFVLLFSSTQVLATDSMSLSDENIEDYYQEGELIYDDLYQSGESESTVPSESSEKETPSAENLDLMSSNDEDEDGVFNKENYNRNNFYKMNSAANFMYVLWTYEYKNNVDCEELNPKFDDLSNTIFNEDKMINYLKKVAEYNEDDKEYRLFFKSLKFSDEYGLNFFERAASNGHFRLLNYFFKNFKTVANNYCAADFFINKFRKNQNSKSMTIFNLAFRTNNFAEVIVALSNGFKIMNEYIAFMGPYKEKNNLLKLKINLNEKFMSEIDDDNLKKIFITNSLDLSVNSKDFLDCFFDAFNDELSEKALNLMQDFALTFFNRIDHAETLKSFINYKLVYEKDNLDKLVKFSKWLVERKNNIFDSRNQFLIEVHNFEFKKYNFETYKTIFNIHCFNDIYMRNYLKLFEEIKTKKIIFNNENEVVEYFCSLSESSIDWEKVNQEYQTMSFSITLEGFRKTFNNEIHPWPEIFKGDKKEKFFAFCKIYFQENSEFPEVYFDQFFMMWLGKVTRYSAPRS